MICYQKVEYGRGETNEERMQKSNNSKCLNHGRLQKFLGGGQIHFDILGGFRGQHNQKVPLNSLKVTKHFESQGEGKAPLTPVDAHSPDFRHP